MFTGLFNLGAGDVAQENKEEVVEDAEQAKPSEEQPAAPALGINLWGLASAVTTTFKARTDELVKSVQQTDWKAELMAFSKEAAEEGKTLSNKTAELVEHLPEVVEHIPEQAEKVAKEFTSNTEVNETITQVGGTLRSFGQSLLVGTKELVEQLRDGVETEIAVATRETKRAGRGKNAAAAAAKLAATGQAGKYKRFEAEVASMQRDSATYCDEPADAEDYAKWRATFSLTAAQADITRILAENAFMAELQSRIVPIIVERDDFWHRYFYRLHKLQSKEEARQQLAERAKARNEEEDVAWDDDEADKAKADTPSEPASGAITGASVSAVDLVEAGAAGGSSAEAAGADVTTEEIPTPAAGTAAAHEAEPAAAAAHEPAGVEVVAPATTPSTQDAHAPASVDGAAVAPEGDDRSASPAVPSDHPAGQPSAVPTASARSTPQGSVHTPTSTEGGSFEGEHDGVVVDNASVSSKGEWLVVGDAASSKSVSTTAPTPKLPSPGKEASTSSVSAQSADEEKGNKEKGREAAAVPSTAAPPVAGVAAVQAAGAAPVRAPVSPAAAAKRKEGKAGSDSELDKEDEAWGDWD